MFGERREVGTMPIANYQTVIYSGFNFVSCFDLGHFLLRNCYTNTHCGCVEVFLLEGCLRVWFTTLKILNKNTQCGCVFDKREGQCEGCPSARFISIMILVIGCLSQCRGSIYTCLHVVHRKRRSRKR